MGRSILCWGLATGLNLVGLLAEIRHDPDRGIILGLSFVCIILCLGFDRLAPENRP